MPNVTIRDIETDEEIAVLTDDGELHTEDDHLREIAQEMTEEGGVITLVPGNQEDVDGYGDWTITPEDEGFQRAFIEYLPSPYAVDAGVMHELPGYAPPDEEVPEFDADDEEDEETDDGESEPEEKDAVTSGTGGVANVRYSPEMEEEDIERAAKSALSEALTKEWTGPHEGERGGTYWLNTETDERRYQENKPAPEEGGGGEGQEQPGADADPGDAGAAAGGPGGDFAMEVTEGVYAEVNPLEPGNYPEPGEPVLIDGETVEAAGDDFYAPTGEHHIQVEYAGRTMSVPVDEVDGIVGEEYNVGDYEDIDTEFELQLADAANAGEVVDAMGARRVVTNVGKIDDPELAFDALEAHAEDGYVSAERKLRGRLRAMGYSSDDIDERLGLKQTQQIPPEHAEFKEAYDPERVVDSGPLPGMGGVNAGAMSYQTLESGENAYVIDYDDPEVHDIGGRDNAMVAYTFLREEGPDEGGVIPPYKLADDGSWLAKKEVEGMPMREAPADWAKKTQEHADEITDAYAMQVLVANSDLHGNNQLIDEEGQIAFIDNDDTQDRAYGASDSGLDMVFRRMSLPTGIQREYGGSDEAKEEIYRKAKEKAEELRGSDRLEEIVDMAEDEAHEGDEVISKVRDTIEYLAEDNYTGTYR